MKESTEHHKLGFEHGLRKQERYKFQDPHLQELYDTGYDSGKQLRDAEDEFLRRRQTIPGFPGRARY